MKAFSLTLIVLALLAMAYYGEGAGLGWLALIALVYAGFWFWDTRHTS